LDCQNPVKISSIPEILRKFYAGGRNQHESFTLRLWAMWMVGSSTSNPKRRIQMAHATTAPTAPITAPKFNPIQWLLRLETAYREAEVLKNADDHTLLDMGITREQADAVFHSRLGQHRYYSK
jgi:uncharacterized protein YjiS (DUF1127 family)